MARTLMDDDERNRRVVLVGEHVKNTGSSTRETARFFTKTYFAISNCTVSDYCKRYCSMRPEEVDELRGRITENTVKTVQDPEIRQRVEYHGRLMEQGMTIQEIEELTGTSFWTIYRDINTRLQVVDPELYNEKIKPMLMEHSQENLKKK